ncbi:MAG: deoxyribodipyrimidine photo-lyase, partial [Alphaproteobacteria bacterium]
MTSSPTIHWFRQDLRLSDNPALCAAAAAGAVVPIYILDDETAGQDRMGSASRWWLHHSLAALNLALDGKLLFFR